MFWRSVPMRRGSTTKLLLVSLVFVCFLFYFKLSTSEENTNATIPNAINNKNENKVLISGKLINQYQYDSNNKTPNGRQSAWLAERSTDDNDDVRSIQNDKYEQEIQLDLMKQMPGLGDEGKAATLSSKASIEIGEHQLAKISLNEELSEHISYNRTIQDARNPLCKNLYFDVNELPTVSVIIIFFNEPYSVLVRTIHSVLNTCDRRSLKEIIIVDDCSTSVELKGKLDYYIRTRFPKNIVKTIRLKNR